MKVDAPTRDAVLSRLDELRSGAAERAVISRWAVAIVSNDDLRVTDRPLWSLLTRLGSADLVATDREYLYGEADFDAWKDELLGEPPAGAA